MKIFIFLLFLPCLSVQADDVRQFHEYMFFKRKLTHDKALAVCKSHNSVLAMPKTPEEYAKILSTVGEPKMDFWLGLKRDNGEEFQYANGESLVYEGWKNDEPNNEGGRQGCVEGHPWVIDEYQWVDQNCAVLNAYVCQFTSQDTIAGLDFEENYPAKIGKQLFLSPVSYYEAFGEKVKYIDAVKACRAKGGDIAMPKTHEEDRKVSDAYKLLNIEADNAYWIGIQRVMEQWRWEDGEAQTFSFNSWHSEVPFVQPDNFLGAPENCAQYKQTFHNWNDCPCTHKMAYVCQKTMEYRVYETPATFADAEAACKANNSTLVMPKTQLEYENIKDTATNIRSFWLGLQRGSGYHFEYTTGGILTYEGWYPKGEDYRDVDEGCVGGYPWVKGQWHEENCAIKLHYVCQFVDDIKTYKAYLETLKFIDAVKFCRARGGDIAMPTSIEEDQKILEASQLENTGEYWIGVQAAMEHWFWLDGEEQTFSYNSWHVDQPDNFKGRQENCAHYKKYLNNWNDVKCSRLYPYICQRYL